MITLLRRHLILTAVLLSLLVHSLVLFWFRGVHVGLFAIPAERHHFPQPLHLKRVEIPLEPASAQALPSLAPLLPQTVPPRLPEAVHVSPQTLAGAPPAALPERLPGSAPSQAPVIPAPPVAASPYSPDDRAKIDAEISKFAIGPATPGLPNLAAPSVPSEQGTSPVLGTTSGQGGTGTTPDSSSALPTLDQVTAQFRTPPPTLNPNLPQPVVLVLPTDILFDFDSAQLRPGADAVLEQALAYIGKYPRADIEIDGHTDSFGTADYNRKLSLDRAAAVQTWLRPQLAAEAFSIETKGLGFARPVVSTKGSIAAQQKNRRVELILRAIPAGQ